MKPEQPPLLEVRDLTLKFRGLTAVDQVNLNLREGEIFTVIGPNGAGKTSLFNAITGIYEPTSGQVLLDGEDLQAHPQPKHRIRWALFGLLFGLILSFWFSDPNQMWTAVVKENFDPMGEGFDYGNAASDLKHYLLAQPRIERRVGRFYIVTADGKSPFGSSMTREAALIKREHVFTMAHAPTEIRDLDPDSGGGVGIFSASGALLDQPPNRTVAELRIDAAQGISELQTRTVWARTLVFIFGSILGFFAARAIWRQTRRTPTSVGRRGIARTFQNIRLFNNMTALENVLVGMDRHLNVPTPFFSRQRLLGDFGWALLPLGLWLLFFIGMYWALLPPILLSLSLLATFAATLFWILHAKKRGTFTRSARAIEQEATQEAKALLDFIGLSHRTGYLAKNLPYGDQRRLEIARAMAARPRLLLLDEPAAGMNPSETGELMQLIERIRARGMTVLLIEHHMRLVMGISDRIAVLVYGKKIAEGTPEEIKENPQVIEAYLGQEEVE